MAILATVSLGAKSALPKDNIVNNWVIGGVGSSITGGEKTAIFTAIEDFYKTARGGMSSALSVWMGQDRDFGNTGVTTRLYDVTAHLDGSSHGPPFASSVWDLGVETVATALPNNLAVCLTLEAYDRASQSVETADGVDPGVLRDRPMQRHTGRVYVGPWGVSALAQDGTLKFGIINATLLDDVRKSVDAMADSIKIAATGAFLGVWSRVDQAVREVTVCSTDNRWDTQRRRLAAPGARTKLTIQTGTGVELAA